MVALRPIPDTVRAARSRKTLTVAILTVTILAGLWPAAAPAQDAEPRQQVGINRNFVSPEEARQRQEQHNHFFLGQDPQPGELGQILDLQTSDYALVERPPGLDYDVYSAIGYGLATSMMVVGPERDADGHRKVVIIDTLEDFGSGQEVATDYLALYNVTYQPSSALAKLPIDAIIYTHNHIDHTGGVLGYLSMADQEPCAAQNPDVRGLGGEYVARRNCVEIISQEKVVDAVVNTSTVSGRMIQARSFYMYGLLLENELSPVPDPKPIGEAITNGIGPYLSRGIAGFKLPSRTFAQEMTLTAAGVHMQVMYVPSETNDELAVFVPDAANGADGCSDGGGCASGLLFSAEVIQGPAFPNLYSLRGTQYRSPANWFRSVDKLRQLDSWCMVPSHGPPVCQRDNVQLLLTNFRDAIQFTHDQTVHFMNQGYTPDELVELVLVPDVVTRDLAKLVPWPNADGGGGLDGPAHPEDYLLPFYGSVPQGVRETYFGYLGWFDGDPVNLAPTPPRIAAERMLKLLGAGGDVVEEARAALEDGEFQWAAELATIAIRANPDDMPAREVKALAFTELGRSALDPNWSDWYSTSANELIEGGSPQDCFNPFAPIGLVSAVTQSNVPLGDWVNSWTWRLDGRKAAAAGAGEIMGFWFDPTEQDFGPQGYVLELRHGIAEYIEWKGTKEAFRDKVTVAVEMSQETLIELILGRATTHARGSQASPAAFLSKGVDQGGVKFLKGDRQALEAFFQYFEDWPACWPLVTLPLHSS